MAQFVQTSQGSEICAGSMIAYLPSGLVGVPGWMASHLIPLWGGGLLVGETL
jgi:hypothetical protein